MAMAQPRRECYVVQRYRQIGERVRRIVEGEGVYYPTDYDQSEPIMVLEAKVIVYNSRVGISAVDAHRIASRLSMLR